MLNIVWAVYYFFVAPSRIDSFRTRFNLGFNQSLAAKHIHINKLITYHRRREPLVEIMTCSF